MEFPTVTNEPTRLRLLIAGGGTGGHVLPAVAVLDELRKRNIEVDALWVGGRKGVERGIAESDGVPFVQIQTGKIRRYLAVETFTDLLRIPIGTVQGWNQVRTFKPDVIYSTGGAVSVPTVMGHAIGAKVKLDERRPILTHEQTAQIGIANRTASKFAATFCVGFEETAVAARQRHSHVVVTGNPIRESLLGGNAGKGRAWAGFDESLPVVYVTGGALGASPLNQRIEAILEDLLQHAQVVHQVGPATANADLARLTAKREAMPPELKNRYKVTDFVRDELPDVYAMTDLVVARAGAGTVSELGYMGLPSVLIPLPGTWGDEQRKNARILSNVGAAVVIEQTDATPERLLRDVLAVLNDPARRRTMGEAAQGTSRPDAAERLVDELLKLAGRA
jgi:UDP-N-acetylglucosamine--N-acetylmuramyl-(pentapeptide) pyrophosphoryl-undecaprenol N-acetylglucosamine transferase